MVISSKDVFLVMEYFKLGPLDQYLRDKKNDMKMLDLIEAAANLASALWYLVIFLFITFLPGYYLIVKYRKRTI